MLNAHGIFFRDKELAKFEAYLNKENCQHINALVRPRIRMAYPIRGCVGWGQRVVYKEGCMSPVSLSYDMTL
jgi:hypothetical protein